MSSASSRLCDILLGADQNHLIRQLLIEVLKMSAQLDALVAAVTANTSVTESAITLLEGLSASLNDLIANGANPAQLQALADQITAETQRLADAVAANTQPAPPAP